MSDELLQYYNRELAYLRRQGAEFARAYPQVAGRLRITEETVEDPHVSRLLEGVAFLTAQIRQRLDGHFPALADVLMGTLYPDYQAPIPSMAMLQLESSPAQTCTVKLSQNQTFETVVEQMPPCQFRCPGDHFLAPIAVVEGKFENSPFDAPRAAGMENAQAVIRLRLRADISLKELDAPNLRFYLHGQSLQSQELYDLILRTGIGFALAPVQDHCQARFFPAEHISSVGFGPTEALIPYGPQSFDGYRLLAEYFLFPEKFLFAQLDGLQGQWPDTTEADLYIYLGKGSAAQEHGFIAEHMRLWCVPVINLFEEILEPVRWDDSEYEYRLTPRYQNTDAFEIVGLDSVNLVNNGNTRELAPYYGLGHPRWQNEIDVYWHQRRCNAAWSGGLREPGTETYLNLVDKRFNAQDSDVLPADEVLVVRARCCNRNIPGLLPFGNGEPFFRAISEPLIGRATALMAPTATVRPELADASRWQLLQHLSLEHFSGADALDRLKAVLHLHDFRRTSESQALIDGIVEVRIKRAVARMGTGVRRGMCQGSEILIQFSKPRYAGTSIYLFSAVLDRFFAQFAQLNSFTRLRIRLCGQSQDYYLWPARAGEGELL